jgi:uncharacterized protein YmfQ (DUF2313 family)
MSDRHVRRSGEDYLHALLALLPVGQAWPRSLQSVLVRCCRGLTNIWGYVDGRAADLLEIETDPRTTVELLPDWERNFGLPDECLPDATSIAERQKMLVLKMTWQGGQSRAYFEYLMDWLGFDITINEYAPFMAGVSQVGDTRPLGESKFRWYIGPQEIRFWWSISINNVSLMWFRASQSRAGVDPHLRIGVPEDLVCLINRWKPAHTHLTFDFSGSGSGDPMAGTP